MFGRKDDFDALLDPIVRIQAGRLRRSLERYYLLAGKADPIRIGLPKGSYPPAFTAVDGATSGPAPKEGLQESRRANDGAIEWPMIVVWPFEFASAPEGDEEVHRLKEGLTVELGRYREARIVPHADEEPSRKEAAHFELRGRIRREADGFVVTPRLIDSTTGEQVWGEVYR